MNCPTCAAPAVEIEDNVLRQKTEVLRCGCFGIGDVLAANITPPCDPIPCLHCGAEQQRAWVAPLKTWRYWYECLPDCDCESCKAKREAPARAAHANAERERIRADMERERKDRERQMRIDAADIPLRFAQCSLDSFDTIPGTDDAKRTIAVFAARLAEHFDAGRGLWLIGPVGVGKTHLAIALLRMALDAGYAGMYLPVRDYMRRLRQSYGDEAPDPLPDASSRGVLVLDDLGSVRLDRNPEHVREALLDLLDNRYLAVLPTIVTSNHTVAELRKDLDERIASRLCEMCERVVLQGEDYRKKTARMAARGATSTGSGQPKGAE